MYCKHPVVYGVPGYRCGPCRGTGNVMVKKKGQAPEKQTCRRCKGRGWDVIMSTINRASCPTCTEGCDGKTFDARNSFVLKALAGLSATQDRREKRGGKQAIH